MKKKILAIGPIVPQRQDMDVIIDSLSFLKNEFQIDVVCPLLFAQQNNEDEFYQSWAKYLEIKSTEYDYFFGFSFGGMILQRCFSVFEQKKKGLFYFQHPVLLANHF